MRKLTEQQQRQITWCFIGLYGVGFVVLLVGFLIQ